MRPPCRPVSVPGHITSSMRTLYTTNDTVDIECSLNFKSVHRLENCVPRPWVLQICRTPSDPACYGTVFGQQPLQPPLLLLLLQPQPQPRQPVQSDFKTKFDRLHLCPHTLPIYLTLSAFEATAAAAAASAFFSAASCAAISAGDRLSIVALCAVVCAMRS